MLLLQNNVSFFSFFHQAITTPNDNLESSITDNILTSITKILKGYKSPRLLK